jgi:hypothetical protein
MTTVNSSCDVPQPGSVPVTGGGSFEHRKAEAHFLPDMPV